MKINIRFAFLITASLVFQFAHAQITKLSNNTNLEGIMLNDKPIFVNGVDNTLWTTDGTPLGTKKFTTKVTSDFTKKEGAGTLGGKLYFAGIDAGKGSELWVTDGTDAGTVLIKDINPGTAGSAPSHFFAFNNQLFFHAATATNGTELWKTDGTAKGTVMVKDIHPGRDGSLDNEYFYVYYFSNNRLLYFAANDGIHGNELWKTNGTEEGTVIVKDINAGVKDGLGGYNQFITLGTFTLFAATDSATGRELWKTDGTEAGTVLVKDISSGSYGSTPHSFVTFNNKIYFSASTADESNVLSNKLWVADGTEEGTNMVKSNNPQMNFSSPSLDNSIIFGNRLVFTAYSPDTGVALWSTDGTADGTVLLEDFSNGRDPLEISLLPDFKTDNLNRVNNHTPPFNGKAFITTVNGTSQSQLWITDGTTQGTVLVKDIYAGFESSVFFEDYFYTADALFFAAFGSDSTWVELWKSNGTSTGTGLVKDINPGKGSSDPTFNFLYDNHLYFTADDGDNNGNSTDLFIVDENVTLPISLYNFAAIALPSKAVKLEWNTTNELNSSHFDVERSADGINFTNINKVNGAGYSGLNKRYQYTDSQPVHLRNPVLFYRLKMVDKDAAFKYSRILAVHFNENSFEFTFSPNPVQNKLSVVVAAAGAKTVALRITDAAGKQVYQQKLSPSQTINQQNINVSGWQKGIYYIQLITDTSVKTLKFVKQ